jgi:hypothetical protein
MLLEKWEIESIKVRAIQQMVHLNFGMAALKMPQLIMVKPLRGQHF